MINEEKLNFNTITRPFKQIDANYLYMDKQFESRGINYKKYMRIRFETINYNLIKDYYTVEGWYLLTYLICNSHNGQYTKSTINIIAEDTKLKSQLIKELLIKFNKQQDIVINKVKGITYNTPIEIFITYNTTEYYQSPIEIKENKRGYRVVPIDYIRTILPEITCEQWAIYSVLAIRYSFYSLSKKYDEEIGKPYYPFKQNHYSFPTIEQIVLATDIPDTTIRRHIKNLENNKYRILSSYCSQEVISYVDKTTGEFKCKKANRIYYINLFEKIEYVYNCIIDIPENRNKDILKLIKQKGFEKLRETDDYSVLTERDYLMEYYKTPIQDYEKALKLHQTNKEDGLNKYKDAREYQIRP